MTTVVVIAGGDRPPSWFDLSELKGAWVVAADSGTDVALSAGIEVDLAVGDLDSVSPSGRGRARQVSQHPADKDQTDLELALVIAASKSPERIVVIGGTGGRVDHFLVNAALIAAPYRWGGQEVRSIAWITPEATIHIVRESIELSGRPGQIVSLIASGGPARGVTTVGLRWPLEGERIDPGSTRTVSNEMIGDTAAISVAAGVLMVVHVGGRL